MCHLLIAFTINVMAPFHPVRRAMCRFELIPLEEMEGRPRVDVLCNMSGIFRDSFQNVVELLDDLFQRAAEADEPESLNFIRCAASLWRSCDHHEYTDGSSAVLELLISPGCPDGGCSTHTDSLCTAGISTK